MGQRVGQGRGRGLGRRRGEKGAAGGGRRGLRARGLPGRTVASEPPSLGARRGTAVSLLQENKHTW